MKRLMLAGALVVLTSANGVLCADWAMFHGDAARTGFSVESTTAGLVSVWDADLGSAVYSSPVIVAGRAYVCTADARLIALDAATGAVLWQQTLPSWSPRTPTVSGGRVYLGCNDHKVYAFNALTGAQLWQATTASWVESSPLVFAGKVFIGGMDHHFYAFDALTGAQVFALPTDGDVITVPSTDGQNVFFAGDDEIVHAVTPLGSPLWQTPAGGAVYGAPVVSEGKIIYGSIANGEGLSYNRVRALNAATGAQIWTQESSEYDFFFATPAVGYGNVYVPGFQGSVYAFDVDNGTPVWARSLGDWALLSSPALSNGVLYFGSNDGWIYALDAFTGAVLDQTPTGAFVASSPAVADGRLVVGSTDGRLYAFDVTAPVAAAVTPGGTTVPPGGTLNFTAAFSELAGQTQNFLGWLIATRPTGQQMPVGAPVPLALSPGQVLNVQARVNVPGAAPPGGYIMAVNAGPTADVLWDAASFAFTITGSGDALASAEDWSYELSSDGDEAPTMYAPIRPSTYALGAPTPNPFNPSTTLRLELPEAGAVSLKVYDASGRLAATLLDGPASSGVHELTWDASGMASGAYFFRLQAGGQMILQRGVLVK